MSEMKDMILDVVDRILKENVDKHSVDLLEQGKWAQDLWSLFVENGIPSVAISETNGGAGGDLEDLLNIIRLTGKYAAPIPFLETTFANTVLERASLHPTERLVTFNPNGQLLLIEDNLITGKINNVPWARFVDEIVTLAKGKDERHYLVLVNLSQGNITPSSNLAGEPRDMVIFHKATITQISSPLTLVQMQQFKTLETTFKLAAITGAIEKVNDLSVQYTKERKQFGRPIHRFQLVQQHLVKLAGETAVTIAAFNNMISSLSKSSMPIEVAFARLRVEDAISQVTAISHQIHAAIGTTYEHSLQQYTRRLWAWREEGPSVNYWSEAIACDLLENCGDQLWSYLTK